MSRGNRKSAVFTTDDDRRCFMNALGETALTYHVRVYAACLMGTHYHIVLDTPRGNLSATMRQLNGEYSQDSNRRHERTGHTFEARFHSIVVERERYLRRVARYVVLNPVKGGLCADAASWPWTTYRATAGLEPCPPWLYIDWLEWAFKADSRSEAQERYSEVCEQTGHRGHCTSTRARSSSEPNASTRPFWRPLGNRKKTARSPGPVWRWFVRLSRACSPASRRIVAAGMRRSSRRIRRTDTAWPT